MSYGLSKLNVSLCLLGSLFISPAYAAISSMVSLSDEELSKQNGQALLSLSYIAPGDAANLSGQNIGFYKVGMEAELELNANIRKLQLGCGGTNGSGGCDIDIDNLSLSGNSSTRDGRASSSAKLTNPFVEFAIKNPESASTREVVGVRLSAEKAVGLLSAGTENSTTPNGINTISGFLRIQSDSSGYVYGKANTAARFLDARANAPYVVNGQSVVYNNEITGLIDVPLGGPTLAIRTTSGGLQIPGMQRIPFIRPGVVVNNNRISSLPLKATLAVPTIKADWRGANQTVNPNYPPAGVVEYYNPNETTLTGSAYSPIDWSFTVPKEVRVQGGALSAQITSCSGGNILVNCTTASLLGVNVGDTLQNAFIKGTITGITGDVTINQGLGYIHSLPINSPVYLSLQGQDLRWPGSYSGANPERTRIDGSIDTSKPATVTDVAKKGWWLSLSDPVNLGSVDPVIDLDIAPLFPQIAQRVSAQLNSNPHPSIDLDGLFAAIGGTADINVTVNAPIDLSANALSLILNDLQLSGQNFAPNCYGTLTFC
jgi:hypothetical protein